MIDEATIVTLLKESATDEAAFTRLVHKVGIAFSTVENIAGSFRAKEPSAATAAPLDHILTKAAQLRFSSDGDDDTGRTTLTKEQLRTLEEDQDKDEDSCAEKVSPVPALHKTQVDIGSVRRSFKLLLACDGNEQRRQRMISTLNSVLGSLVECLPFDLQCTMSKEKVENIFTSCIVLLEIFALGESHEPRPRHSSLLFSSVLCVAAE